MSCSIRVCDVACMMEKVCLWAPERLSFPMLKSQSGLTECKERAWLWAKSACLPGFDFISILLQCDQYSKHVEMLLLYIKA